MNETAANETKSILICSIDAEIRERLFNCLCGHGYRVDAVGSGTAATERLAKDRYGAIVVDAEAAAVVSVSDTALIRYGGSESELLEALSDAFGDVSTAPPDS